MINKLEHKRFYDFCKNFGFNDQDVKNLLKISSLNDGRINAAMIRGHFPISWAASAQLAEEMSSCGLATLEERITGGVKRLPDKDVLGLWKKNK